MVSIRLMLKDLTINLLVGLSYSKLRKIFYSYFGILFLINLIIVFSFTAMNRYGCWLRKDAAFVTYGLLGLIGMDWLSLLVVVASDIIIGIIVVENQKSSNFLGGTTMTEIINLSIKEKFIRANSRSSPY